MSAKTFIGLMLILLLFTTGLAVFSATGKKEAVKTECPAGTDCAEDNQMQAADGMIWETVSKHLLSVVQ